MKLSSRYENTETEVPTCGGQISQPKTDLIFSLVIPNKICTIVMHTPDLLTSIDKYSSNPLDMKIRSDLLTNLVYVAIVGTDGCYYYDSHTSPKNWNRRLLIATQALKISHPNPFAT